MHAIASYRPELSSQLFVQAAKIAISCSYRIFNARSSQLWDLTDLVDVLYACVFSLCVCVCVCVCVFAFQG